MVQWKFHHLKCSKSAIKSIHIVQSCTHIICRIISLCFIFLRKKQDQTRILLNKMYSIFNSLVNCFPHRNIRLNSSACFLNIRTPTLLASGYEEDREREQKSHFYAHAKKDRIQSKTNCFLFSYSKLWVAESIQGRRIHILVESKWTKRF